LLPLSRGLAELVRQAIPSEWTTSELLHQYAEENYTSKILLTRIANYYDRENMSAFERDMRNMTLGSPGQTPHNKGIAPLSSQHTSPTTRPAVNYPSVYITPTPQGNNQTLSQDNAQQTPFYQPPMHQPQFQPAAQPTAQQAQYYPAAAAHQFQAPTPLHQSTTPQSQPTPQQQTAHQFQPAAPHRQEHPTNQPAAPQSYPQALPVNYSRNIQDVAKWCTEDIKYSGEGDSFDYKLEIFLSNCRRAYVPQEAMALALPAMLKGPALDFFYSNSITKDPNVSFDLACQTIRGVFENDEHRRAIMLKWDTLSLNSVAARPENSGKDLQVSLSVLVKELRQLQHSLSPRFRCDEYIYHKLINACREVPACSFATYMPAPTLPGLINNLQSSIST
jgi:hypothetical protein